MRLLLTLGHPLNVMQFGDEQAQQLGIPVRRVRRLTIITATMATAAAVAFVGVIGFVGSGGAASSAHAVGRGLPQTFAALHAGRGSSAAGDGYGGADDHCSAGDPGGNHHRAAWSTFLPVGAAAFQITELLVIPC